MTQRIDLCLTCFEKHAVGDCPDTPHDAVLDEWPGDYYDDDDEPVTAEDDAA